MVESKLYKELVFHLGGERAEKCVRCVSTVESFKRELVEEVKPLLYKRDWHLAESVVEGTFRDYTRHFEECDIERDEAENLKQEILKAISDLESDSIKGKYLKVILSDGGKHKWEMYVNMKWEDIEKQLNSLYILLSNRFCKF